ncbi:hypothetical protein KC957_02655 [Candidatus Saccharibacteria bacterium]|nr:hypothetical protein [Candidatus Saccharibacteria bacterium]
MADIVTRTHEGLAGVSPRCLDATVQSRAEDPREPGTFLAVANGGLALKLAGIAHDLPHGMTAEEAYLLGAADVVRTVAAHQESQALEASISIA